MFPRWELAAVFFFVHLMQSVPCVTVGSTLALVYFLSFYNVAGQELFLIFNNNATDGNKKVIYLLNSSIWSTWEKSKSRALHVIVFPFVVIVYFWPKVIERQPITFELPSG